VVVGFDVDGALIAGDRVLIAPKLSSAIAPVVPRLVVVGFEVDGALIAGDRLLIAP
jgi:hypothetical protein